LLLNLVASLFKPKSQLEAENAALRQQLIVLQRKLRGRVQFTNSDRLFFIQLYRWFPSVLRCVASRAHRSDCELYGWRLVAGALRGSGGRARFRQGVGVFSVTSRREN
jgi:hypothetical protein